MVGITPRKAVSFLIDAYGGCTSNRQIMEDCTLYTEANHYFEKGDSIVADRVINVQDLFALQGVKLNIPTMLKEKTQLDPGEIAKDTQISSMSVETKRVIDLAKRLKLGFPAPLMHLS